MKDYPIFLVFGSDGHIVHRMVGGSADAKSFVPRTQESLDPDKQYYTLLQQYQAGKKDSSFLRRLAQVSVQAYDMPNARQVAKAYFATQTSIYNTVCLDLLGQLTGSTQDEGFATFLHHPKEWVKIPAPANAEKKV